MLRIRSCYMRGIDARDAYNGSVKLIPRKNPPHIASRILSILLIHVIDLESLPEPGWNCN